MRAIVDLFAGPGGWDIAAQRLGFSVVGIELDESACATRDAAGLTTIRGDVRDYDPFAVPSAALIASPPCPTFSVAGKGSSRADIPAIIDAMPAVARTGVIPYGDWSDAQTGMVLEPLRWAALAHDADAPYDWIALEQVPPVLPVWEAIAHHLRGMGYHVVTGNLNAEQYGVPQTRRRAVLVATLGRVATLPVPTHSAYCSSDPGLFDPFVHPWVPMSICLKGALALQGRSGPRRIRESTHPSFTMTGNYGGSDVLYMDTGYRGGHVRPASWLARTMTGRSRDNRLLGVDGVRLRNLTPQEAAAIQTFPDHYPWQGNKREVFQQIGNAVPPLIAERVICAAAGMAAEAMVPAVVDGLW